MLEIEKIEEKQQSDDQAHEEVDGNDDDEEDKTSLVFEESSSPVPDTTVIDTSKQLHMLDTQASSGLNPEDAQEAGYETPPDESLECTS